MFIKSNYKNMYKNKLKKNYFLNSLYFLSSADIFLC